MALTIRTQVISYLADPTSGINIQQQKAVDDLATPATLDLNFTMKTLQLTLGKSLDTDWTKVSKGDMTNIRDICFFLTSVPEVEGIDILITNIVDPNAATGTAKTFKMREIFTATVDMDADQDIWIRNPGTVDATLIAILGGENEVE